MRPCANQNNVSIRFTINQQPVRFDMTFTAIVIVATQFMITVSRRQLQPFKQGADDFSNTVPGLSSL